MSGSGNLFVLAGPSGVGKTTLEKRLFAELPDLSYSVSATTRPPRPGERDGKDYLFISPERFREMRDRGELLEWAEFYGNSYGTPARPVEEAVRQGKDLLIDVEVEGVAQLRQRFGREAVYILIMPPSFSALKERLSGRGSEDGEALAARLDRAKMEIARLKSLYEAHNKDRALGNDYLVVNDDLEKAFQELKAVLVATRAGLARRVGFLDRLLDQAG